MAEEIRAQVIAEVDAQRDRLREISQKIHDNPELSFQEHQAAAWLTQYLKESGFHIEEQFCRLPTAFRASYGKERPVIALMAEYDALPGLGHACGHNIIAASAVGAAVASRMAVDRYGGNLTVIGTPAEEVEGGKAIMAQRGAFNDLDIAMMVHPGTADIATSYALACQSLDVEFFGKAAHASARPEDGINALEAMVQAFTSVNSLRQHIREKSRIHGIITSGGEAPNIVPAYSAGSFLVRAEDNRYLDELKEKVLNCFVGAATATGARLEYHWGDVRFAPMLNNLVLAELFTRHMQFLGRKIQPSDRHGGLGSTDMGNVSQLVPSIHPFVAIAPPGITIHSSGFAQAAVSEDGVSGLLVAAKAMALTVIDLLSQPGLVEQVKEEFARYQ